jgi:hypothetical protein
MTDKERKSISDPDKFGVGMTEDGKVRVLTPAQHVDAVALRNAEEAEDEDLSYLDEIEGEFAEDREAR